VEHLHLPNFHLIFEEKPVKIGLVLEKFDPHMGGLEHWTWQFALRLLRRNYEVHVIAFEANPAAAGSGLVLHQLDMPHSRLERAEVLERHLRTLDLDVIHDMGCGWYADLFHPHGGSTIALWEHNLMRIPRWRQIRFWRERRYREMAEIERRQLTCSDATVVTVSKMVQRHFETFHHLPKERMRLIYNGVDLEQFSPAQRPLRRAVARQDLGLKDEVLFVMLAHNLLLKNANALLQAAARLLKAGRPIRVLIAGGKRPKPFIKLADRLGIAQCVTFRDPLEDPTPYYAAADVFVHPTWYDPCSLVTLEASASALPVITTRYNGASELMSDGREGYILDKPDDASSLAAMMEKLMDGELRERMGTAGRELVSNHSFEQQTTEFLELYDEIVQKRKQG
jgi:UDP-glucose:(heptosyl)LPS alpha-1,3-glucosyltransferase